ncbi:hypothetical protein BDV59DRAFT_188118 [Aspergillus ambiguus]|uniref:uncharacterized protein n=1 Tax=Aspergillus ambiguus TaxID=176160 RepID=UPI003CCCE811
MEGDIRNGSLSSLSLPLPCGQGTNKRRLLLVYIHGFMGSEASFHNLPAHVHNLLTGLLSDSHAVYTRIYPRYKSHGEIQTAAEQFSAWLSPHEADDLDVILLGHSLGGIVAADVALLQRDGQPRHRILGLVNFDVPFLGLHPRVIPTGVSGSIPKKDPATEDKLDGEQECSASVPVTPNANFNPAFTNDVRLPERGFFRGIMHFVNKNTDNLSRSIFNRLVSSVTFAGCVSNYPELRQRYKRLVALETAEGNPRRVRFVNYYTASTGRTSRKSKAGDTTPSRKHSETSSEAAISTTTTKTLEGQAVGLSTHQGDDLLADKESSSHERNRPTVDNACVASSTLTDQKDDPCPSECVSISTSETGFSSDDPKRRLRKFILLPSHHWKHEDNANWTPVLMENMDEVIAHQSMFLPHGPNYDYLVGDTVALVEKWVQDDLTRRLLQESLD